jgi:lipopolysaccharide exporter
MGNPSSRLVDGAARVARAPFLRNMLVVMSGTAIAQLLGFALAPVIGHLFSPDQFGVYGMFDAISSVVAAAVTLDYAQAIVLPRSDREAMHVFCLACVCTAAASLVTIVGTLLVPVRLLGALASQGRWVISLLAVAAAAAGINQASQAWCIRRKAFRRTAASQVVRSVSSNGMQIGFGLLRAGAPGLVVSAVTSNVLASLNFVRVVLPDIRSARKDLRWADVRRAARDYRDFPLFSASENVISAVSRGLPVILLTHFYGIAAAGAYAFGIRILQAPMGFALGALRQVLFQRASEAHNNGARIGPLYRKATLGLLACCVVPAACFVLWAPQIFVLVFGPQWRTAGDLARSLVLWLACMFCNLPAELFAKILRLQRYTFFIDITSLVLRTAALTVGGLFLPVSTTVLLFSIVGAGINVGFITYVGAQIAGREAKRMVAGAEDGPPPGTESP